MSKRKCGASRQQYRGSMLTSDATWPRVGSKVLKYKDTYISEAVVTTDEVEMAPLHAAMVPGGVSIPLSGSSLASRGGTKIRVKRIDLYVKIDPIQDIQSANMSQDMTGDLLLVYDKCPNRTATVPNLDEWYTPLNSQNQLPARMINLENRNRFKVVMHERVVCKANLSTYYDTIATSEYYSCQHSPYSKKFVLDNLDYLVQYKDDTTTGTSSDITKGEFWLYFRIDEGGGTATTVVPRNSEIICRYYFTD